MFVPKRYFSFRVVLFWTELKPRGIVCQHVKRFRVVLFWTELKPFQSWKTWMVCFRVVLFWTELKQRNTAASFTNFSVLELCYFGLN